MVTVRTARRGIIPARAGFTPPCPSAPGVEPDHPRSRGVYFNFTADKQYSGGSSPLARGLRAQPAHDGAPARIIPARAGFTHFPSPRPQPGRDHPRSRGVYGWPAVRDRAKTGSSPLARGLRLPKDEDGEKPSDHPRSRGVYRGGVPRRRISGGSSPLARGLREYTPAPPRVRRIIPARAGFTRTPWPGSAPQKDHPRSRGVYVSAASGVPETVGSSPLARGLRLFPGAGYLPLRIIPARAGFTDPMSRPSATVRDHPRSRGVYTVTSMTSSWRRGSSPLARGLPGWFASYVVPARIIPARAGFT